MVSLAFLLKLMEIIQEKIPDCISIMLGFRQYLGGVCTKTLINFGCMVRVHFGGNTPKLVEWINFRNFGFKVNLVTKTIRVYKCFT